MTIKDVTIAWINEQDYETLLRRWRFSKIGDPIFRKALGEHYLKVMTEKKLELSSAEQVAVSKRIGWE